MRKITLTVLLLSALSFFAQAQEKTFSISGKIELDKGNLLVLTQSPKKIDTLAKTAHYPEPRPTGKELRKGRCGNYM